jgi:hypothetical protein
MTTEQKIIKNKVGLLKLAEQLGRRIKGVQGFRLFQRQFLSI